MMNITIAAGKKGTRSSLRMMFAQFILREAPLKALETIFSIWLLEGAGFAEASQANEPQAVCPSGFCSGNSVF